MNIDNQREAFEAWARKNWPEISIQRYVTGKYVVTCLNYAFEAYQAALESPEVRELRVALEMIAGMRPCPDSLMGNADIARAALAVK